jgi:hypothetical protein
VAEWDEIDDERLEELMREAVDPTRPPQAREEAWRKARMMAELRRIVRPRRRRKKTVTKRP